MNPWIRKYLQEFPVIDDEPIVYASVSPRRWAELAKLVDDMINPIVAGPLVNNYECTRCHNKKLNTKTDKACWWCGEKVKT